MGIIVTKENEKSSVISDRITADLRAKAVATDFVKQPDPSSARQKFKKTSKTSWFWIALVSLAVVSAAFIIIF